MIPSFNLETVECKMLNYFVQSQETPALVYAKELCDKLEHSMCALAGGKYNLRYKILD